MKNIVNGIIEQSDRLLKLYKKHKVDFEGRYELSFKNLFLDYTLYFAGDRLPDNFIIDYQVFVCKRKNERRALLRLANDYQLTNWSFEFTDNTLIDETELSTLLQIITQDVNTFETYCDNQQLKLF